MSERMPPKPPRLTKPVVLVGMMGAGKSAVGLALSRLLEVEFLDSDEALVEAANMSIAEIFERDGEAFFRKRETEVIDRLLTGAPAIVSTGGGAFMAERNRALISAKGVSLWLKADLELLWNRVKHKTTRPLLQTDDARATLGEIFAARDPIYAQADLFVEAREAYSIEEMAQAVCTRLIEAGIVET
ncbi:MAG: shikimate kinase [Pseudomonadota bacterium]